jgi:HAD superfamily hydrolase (TIGR01450 family)
MTSSPQPRPRLAIVDLDGVVYRGERPIPRADVAIARLEAAGMLVRFATNNSTIDRQAYVERLAQFGIVTRRDAVVTSTSATIAHLGAHAPHVRVVMAIGSAGMVRELAAAGLQVTAADDAVPRSYEGGRLATAFDAVIVGLDRDLTYRRLAAAATAIGAGASFVATNADARYPTAQGFLPGAGSAVAAIAVATGVEPLVIGKPAPAMFGAILANSGVPAAEAIVVGDNPDSDILAARRAGIRSVLVLSGVTDAAAAATLAGDRRPDVVLDSLADLPDLLGLPALS